MRKSKYTEAEISKALDVNGSVARTAQALNCTQRTVYNYLIKYPDLQEQLDDFNEKQIDLVESKLMELISEGNITAIIFFLKCRAKHRGYTEKTIIQTQQAGYNVNYEVTLEEASSPVLRQKAIEYLSELNRIREARN